MDSAEAEIKDWISIAMKTYGEHYYRSLEYAYFDEKTINEWRRVVYIKELPDGRVVRVVFAWHIQINNFQF